MSILVNGITQIFNKKSLALLKSIIPLEVISYVEIWRGLYMQNKYHIERTKAEQRLEYSFP